MPCVLYWYRWVLRGWCSSWRDLASCLCPKAPSIKLLLAVTWEGETSYWWRKAGLNQCLSQGETVWKILGWVMCYFEIWPGRSVYTHALELQARRCFCRYKPAWSCHVLLDPRREGEIWQKGNSSLVLQDLLWFLKFCLSEENWNSFQKLEEINSPQGPFQNPSALPRSTQGNSNLLVRTLIWNIKNPGLGPCSSFPFVIRN